MFPITSPFNVRFGATFNWHSPNTDDIKRKVIASEFEHPPSNALLNQLSHQIDTNYAVKTDNFEPQQALHNVRRENHTRSSSLQAALQAQVTNNYEALKKTLGENTTRQLQRDTEKLIALLFEDKNTPQQIPILALLGRLDKALEKGKNDTTAIALRKTVQELQTLQSHTQFLTNWGRLTADGVTRLGTHTMSAEKLDTLLKEGGTLSKHYPKGEPLRTKHLDSWIDTEVGGPVADMIVIGAGPAGLASGYYAAKSGLRTIVLDAGHVSQSFSDSGIKSVHWMRTSQRTTTLALRGLVPDALHEEIGMEHLNRLQRSERSMSFRTRAKTGHQNFQRISGQILKGRSVAETRGHRQDPQDPVTRAELFQTFDRIADIINEQDNALVLERSPVTRIQKQPNHLYAIETANGYRLLTRKLIIATGAVGTQGENANHPSVLENLAQDYSGRYLSLKSHNDLANQDKMDTFNSILKQNSQRTASQTPGLSRQLILTDGLLGTPQIQRYLVQLPRGTRMAVVGSGESAAKAAIELLVRNPDLNVDLFTKEPLQPAQVQVPKEFFTPKAIRAGIAKKRIGLSFHKTWVDKFKTPITPQTMRDLLSERERGRLRVFEMGTNFDTNSVRLESVKHPNGQLVARIWTQPGSNVLQTLKTQDAKYQKAGLAPSHLPSMHQGSQSSLLAEIDGGIVTAAGYSRAKIQNSAIFQQLHEQGLVEQDTTQVKKRQGEMLYHPKNRLTSSKDSNIAIIGANSTNGTASDSAIPGMSSRAYYTVEFMRNDLRHPDASGQPQDSDTRQRLSALPVGAKLKTKKRYALLKPTIKPQHMNPDIGRFSRFRRRNIEERALSKHPNDKILRSIDQRNQDGVLIDPRDQYLHAADQEVQQRIKGAPGIF